MFEGEKFDPDISIWPRLLGKYFPIQHQSAEIYVFFPLSLFRSLSLCKEEKLFHVFRVSHEEMKKISH